MGALFIISGSSGSGKTSLVNELVLQLNPPFLVERAVTFTTKVPRSTEKNGYDYHFISVDDFEMRIRKGFFLEHSNTYGAYYGIPRSIIDELERGLSYFLILDRAGAQEIVHQLPESILIWIYTQRVESLEERLHARGTETAEQIKTRLLLAKQEVMQEATQSFYQYHVLNDNFEVAISSLTGIVVPILKRV